MKDLSFTVQQKYWQLHPRALVAPPTTHGPTRHRTSRASTPPNPRARGFFLFLTATTLSSILPHWLSSSSLVVESEKSHPLPTRVYSDCVPSPEPIFLYPTFTLLYNRLQFIIVQFRHIISDRSMMEIRSWTMNSCEFAASIRPTPDIFLLLFRTDRGCPSQLCRGYVPQLYHNLRVGYSLLIYNNR